MNILTSLLAKVLPQLLGNIPLVSGVLQKMAGDKPWYKRTTIWAGLVWWLVYSASTGDWFGTDNRIDSVIDHLNDQVEVLGPLFVALGINKNLVETLKKLGAATNGTPDAPRP